MIKETYYITIDSGEKLENIVRTLQQLSTKIENLKISDSIEIEFEKEKS